MDLSPAVKKKTPFRLKDDVWNCKCKENITMRSTEAGFSLGDNLHVSDSKGPQ